MGDGDPVGQRQFSETMSSTKREILEAVEKVNGHTQDLRVDVGQVQTSLDANEKRMNDQDTRMDGQDKKIEGQKNWNRGLAAVEAAMAAVLVALGIGKE